MDTLMAVMARWGQRWGVCPPNHGTNPPSPPSPPRRGWFFGGCGLSTSLPSPAATTSIYSGSIPPPLPPLPPRHGHTARKVINAQTRGVNEAPRPWQGLLLSPAGSGLGGITPREGRGQCRFVPPVPSGMGRRGRKTRGLRDGDDMTRCRLALPLPWGQPCHSHRGHRRGTMLPGSRCPSRRHSCIG